MGRPTTYTTEIAEAICTELAAGRSLRAICDDEGMPHRDTVHVWLHQFHDFSDQYARARERQAEYFADEIIEIADTPMEGVRVKETDRGTETITGDMVERSKLRVDARKWFASKVAPKKFGDKFIQEHTGPNVGLLQPTMAILTPADGARAYQDMLKRTTEG